MSSLKRKAEHTTTEILHKKVATKDEIEIAQSMRYNILKKSKNIAHINVQNVEEFIEENEYSSSVEEEKEE
ncbi:9148_t:CDS:2 [Gigaspora margarita]|uniref:9148_t:CDS:1 n=1 Tax=Gigaspora margarita TaxID=4874 RepID=A0ABN7U107_GIGMA|nr:9148_t:CDS:2 [Gigaspora margarita]